MGSMADVSLVCHPYTAKKDVGAGHDRYVFELTKQLNHAGISYEVLASGNISSFFNAAYKEALFPVRLLSHHTKIYHATAAVPARSPIWVRKKPLLTTIHDVIWFFETRQDAWWKSAYKKYCIRLAAQKSDCLIVPAESTKSFLIDQLDVSADRIRLIPYGIDHEQFYPGEKPDNEIKKILFVGATNRAKGVDSLIQCFDQVVRAYPKVELHIASKGWDTPNLQELHQRSSVCDKIKFVGFIAESDLRLAYVQADIVVFPSRYGFGLSTFEAMACGTPVISGDRLDAPDYIGDSGILVNPDEWSALAGAMIRLLTDKLLYQLLQQKGLKRVQNYSWKKMGLQIVDLYREFI